MLGNRNGNINHLLGFDQFMVGRGIGSLVITDAHSMSKGMNFVHFSNVEFKCLNFLEL